MAINLLKDMTLVKKIQGYLFIRIPTCKAIILSCFYLFTAPAYAFDLLAKHQLPINTSWDNSILNLALSPNGKLVGALTRQDFILYNLLSKERVSSFPSREHNRLDFSPDGSLIALSTSAGQVSLWSIKEKRILWVADGLPTGSLHKFGPLGRRILVGGWAGAFSLLDAKNGHVLVSTGESNYHTFDAAFSPDGRNIFLGTGFSQGNDGAAIRIIDSETGIELENVSLASAPSGLALSRDGKNLVTITQSGVVDVWMTSPLQKLHSDITGYDWRDGGDRIKYFGKNGSGFRVITSGYLYETNRPFPLNLDLAHNLNAFTVSNDGSQMVVTSRNGDSALQILATPYNSVPNMSWITRSHKHPALETRQKIVEKARTSILSNDINSLSSIVDRGEVFKIPSDPPLLILAASEGSREAMDVLLAAGADADALAPRTGWTALMWAAKAGNASAIDALLAHGARADIIGPMGATFTSLLINSQIGPEDTSQAGLLKKKILAQISTRHKDELLAKSAGRGDRHLVATLLNIGANANYADARGQTPLMYVSVSGSSNSAAIIRDLIVFGGADPDFVSKDDATALSLAIATNAENTALRYLVSASDLGHRTNNGSSYWDLAEQLDNSAALAALPTKPWEPPQIEWRSFPPTDVQLSPKMSRDDIRLAQRKLQAQGLYSGAIDGLWGPASRRGLAAFFKVTLDDYYISLEKLCNKIPRSLNGSLQDGDVQDVGSEKWLFLSRNSTISIQIHNRIEGTIKCYFAQSGKIDFTLTEAYWRSNYYTFKADYQNQCATRRNFNRIKMTRGGSTVVGDYTCRNLIAGIPKNDAGALTIWHKY